MSLLEAHFFALLGKGGGRSACLPNPLWFPVDVCKQVALEGSSFSAPPSAARGRPERPPAPLGQELSSFCLLKFMESLVLK